MLAINKLLDDLVTKQLAKFLAMGVSAATGEKCSDVVVKDGNVALKNVYAKPETVNHRLALARKPFRVAMLHCKRVTINIPWFSMATGNLEVNVDDLFVILHPTVYERDASELRQTKELEVIKAIEALLKKQAKATKGDPPDGLLARLKAQLRENFKPKIKVNRVHVRYEQFGAARAMAQGDGFSLGFLLHSCTIEKDDGGDGDPTTSRIQAKLDTAGVYCRTASSGARALAENLSHSTEPGFFASQASLVDAMRALEDEAVALQADAWLLGPLNADCTVTKAKFSPHRLHLPTTKVELVVRPFHFFASDEQIGALFSLQVLQKRYRLWEHYALLQPDGLAVGRPHPELRGQKGSKARRGGGKGGATNTAWTRPYWQAAGRAVTQVVSGRSFSSKKAMQALGLKRRYLELLSEMYRLAGVDEPEDIDDPDEAARLRGSLPAERRLELQSIEDTVSVHALAWWRLLAIVDAKEEKKAAKAARRQGRHVMNVLGSVGDKLSRKKEFGLDQAQINSLTVLSENSRRKPYSDAPPGYTFMVVTLALETFTVRLIRQSDADEAGDPGETREVLTLQLRGIAARRESRHRFGSLQSLELREVVAWGGQTHRLVRIAADADEDDLATAHPLSPPPGSPEPLKPPPAEGASPGGDLPEGKGSRKRRLRRLSLFPKKRGDGGAISSRGEQKTARDAAAAAAAAAAKPGSSTALTAGGASDSLGRPNGSPPATPPKPAKPRATGPALTVRAELGARPSQGVLAVHLAPVVVLHAREPYEELKAFFAPAEAATQRSPLMTTAVRRAKATLLLQLVAKALKQPHEKPEAIALGVFKSALPIFVAQPKYPALDVNLKGVTLRLTNPAVPHVPATAAARASPAAARPPPDAMLISMRIPAMSVRRQPALAGGRGSRAAITFDEPLVFDTPVNPGRGLTEAVKASAVNGPDPFYAAAILQQSLAEHDRLEALAAVRAPPSVPSSFRGLTSSSAAAAAKGGQAQFGGPGAPPFARCLRCCLPASALGALGAAPQGGGVLEAGNGILVAGAGALEAGASALQAGSSVLELPQGPLSA